LPSSGRKKEKRKKDLTLATKSVFWVFQKGKRGNALPIHQRGTPEELSVFRLPNAIGKKEGKGERV